MKIAIDLNDVVRDYSNNFVKYYIERYNHEFKLDDIEIYTRDLSLVFPFRSDRVYQKFIYEDYCYELYGKCPTCGINLERDLNKFVDETIKNIDEDVELMFVSPYEALGSIGCTYMFIAKLGVKVRECYLPTDSATIWDRCDVLVTANPGLLDCKPEGKISIKIDTDYNKESVSDYRFNSLSKFINNEDNLVKLLSHGAE